MSVRGLSGYTLSWIQQRGEAQPKRATPSEDRARRSVNELQVIEQEGTQEFSKDELKRMRGFMSSIGERVDSIDGVITNFERIDTKRKGAITAEQVKAFESSASDATVPAQPLMLDQNEASAAMAKAPLESYLNKYTAKSQQKTSTFERSE